MNVDDGSTVEFVVDNDAGDDDSNYNIMVVFFCNFCCSYCILLMVMMT